MSAPIDHGTRLGEVWLVAKREISVRIRSKALRTTTALLALALVAMSVLVSFLGSDEATQVGATDESLAAAVESTATSLGQNVEATVIGDVRAGTVRVTSGELAAMITTDGTTVRAIVEQDIDPGLETTLQAVARQLVLEHQVTELGGDPAEVAAALSGATVQVEPQTPPRDFSGEQLVLGMITGILIYIALLITGQMVAQGVVEEKSSRVVEILLSTIRPWQLMAGKVLGIGIVGLLQLAIVAIAGLISALAMDSITIPTSAAVSTVVWLLVWFVLGFFTFALVFAAAAALVSRQEDVAGVIAPASMLVIVGYVIGVTVVPSDPDSRLVEVLSMIPFLSPTLMPIRLAMGGVPVWQQVLSVALSVAIIPVLVWFAGRIYSNAVMRTGARIKLRDALREV